MSPQHAPRKRAAPEESDKPLKRRSRRPRRRQPKDADRGVEASPDRPPRARHEALAHLQHSQASYACAYSTASAKWSTVPDAEPARDDEKRGIASSLNLVTFNTWSSAPEHTHSQTTAVLDLLAGARADIVALQEVSKPFESTLRKQRWVQAEWVLTSLDEYWRVAGKDGQGKGKKPAKREGVVVMLKKDLWSYGCKVGFVRLKRANNEQAKALVTLRIVREGSELLRIATSHFSSLPQNARLRRSQYSIALSMLNASPRASHSILLGDFNASSSLELDVVSAQLRDVGPVPSKSQLAELSSREEKEDLAFRHRPTFGALYPLVSLDASKPRRPRRIDRIYVSKGTKSSHYRELGDEAIPGEKDKLGKGGKRYPSDHLAVGVRVSLE